MEAISNRLFFDLACNGYFPLCISRKGAYYVSFDKDFTRHSKSQNIYSGCIYELIGSDFTPVFDIEIHFSKRCLFVSSCQFVNRDMWKDNYYLVSQMYPGIFLPVTNHKALSQKLSILLFNYKSYLHGS